MKRIRLTVAYDGTAYHGWQVQNNARTVAGELNRALSGLFGGGTDPETGCGAIEVIGASRTDTGVHALGNVAVFDTDTRMPAEKIAYALNQRLPDDIRVRLSEEVPPDFHPRKCAGRKTYEYRIYHDRFPLPTRRLYACYSYAQFDVAAMRRAVGYVVGEHDFASFCASGSQAQTTVRTIYDASVEEEGREIVIRVCGNGFLYHMVRILAGTLMEVGKGALPPEQMEAILAAKNRSAAGPTAPACGLTLIGCRWEEPGGKQE